MVRIDGASSSVGRSRTSSTSLPTNWTGLTRVSGEQRADTADRQHWLGERAAGNILILARMG